MDLMELKTDSVESSGPFAHMPKIVLVRDDRFSSIQSFVDSEYVLQYCLNGDVDFRVENAIYSMTAGTALIMPPNTPHGYHVIRSLEQRYIIVHFILPPNSNLLTLGTLHASFDVDLRERVASRLLSLRDEWNAQEIWHELVAPGLLLEVLGLTVRYASESIPPPGVQAPSWRNVDTVIRWLHQCYWNDISIDKMSEVAGLSPAHFCKSFKAYTGISPHQYLIQIRIEKARELLCDANMTCGAIAERVGFPTSAAFSRTFRKVIGKSPMHWINQYPTSHLRRRTDMPGFEATRSEPRV
jgi:AraC-like DNA-binding protein